MRPQRLMEIILAGCAWLVLFAIVLRWVLHLATNAKSIKGRSWRSRARLTHRAIEASGDRSNADGYAEAPCSQSPAT
jgi:hypothetical protein